MTDVAQMIHVFSIFKSIQGESTKMGLPCIFVRLAGCPLNCNYCDTVQARTAKGRAMEVAEVLDEVASLGLSLVEVTGGEPLAQDGTPGLLKALVEAGYEVLLETSGAFSIEEVDPRVRVILDVKCPDSGMSHRIDKANFDVFGEKIAELKFVISSKKDFDWAVNFCRTRGLLGHRELLISPVVGALCPVDVADWIIKTDLPLRLQLQLHKIIWPDSQEER
jgi:7-carboxy-7-deazaguanine synthase